MYRASAIDLNQTEDPWVCRRNSTRRGIAPEQSLELVLGSKAPHYPLVTLKRHTAYKQLYVNILRSFGSS